MGGSGFDGATVVHLMMQLLAEINIKDRASKVEPILLDALLHRFGVTGFGPLWDTIADARTALTRLALDDVQVASQIHAGLLKMASTRPLSPTIQLLLDLQIHDFFQIWQ